MSRRHQLLLVCWALVWSTSLMVSIEASQPDIRSDEVTSNELIEEQQQVSGGDIELPCGVGFPSNSSSRPRIYGGVDADPGEYPWMVNIHKFVDDGQRRRRQHSCGGVIIDKRHILTAKHCLKLNPINENLNRYAFYIGDYDQTGADGEQDITIERVIFKNLTSDAISDDIALVRTKQAMEFRLTKAGLGSVNRICLPRGEKFNFKFQHNRTVTVAGWGRIDRLEPAAKLKKVDVSIKQCQEQVYEFSRLTLCTTTDKRRAPCKGDSGGPLFVRSSTSGQFILAGIVQAGPIDPCADGRMDAIYANVHGLLDWIDSFIYNNLYTATNL